MRRIGCVAGLVGGLVFSAVVAGAQTTTCPNNDPFGCRLTVDQPGDFVLIGNVLGHDCRAREPDLANMLEAGSVGTCCTGLLCNMDVIGNVYDTAPDVFWIAGENSATANTNNAASDARTTAVLHFPVGAEVTHAWLYWAGERGSSSSAADLNATIERPGSTSLDAGALRWAVANNGTSNYYYQSVADVTSYVQQHGTGAYRVSGVDTVNLVNRSNEFGFVAWWMVVFYRLDSEPYRNLTLFDGLVFLGSNQETSVTLSGFLVPPSGKPEAKLGVIAYEGDHKYGGDYLYFERDKGLLTGNARRLWNKWNPSDNFFNGTRTYFDEAVSLEGDLPQYTGMPDSMQGLDMDVVDVSDKLHNTDDTAYIQTGTNLDEFLLGAFVTSITTYKPDFTLSTKTVLNESGNPVTTALPEEVLTYSITVANTGTDAAINVMMEDTLPEGVSFVSDSITVDLVSMSDDADGDMAEYDDVQRRVSARLGTFAVGQSSTVEFKVTVDYGTTGTIPNIGKITATGDGDGITESYDTGRPGEPGTPTEVFRYECGGPIVCKLRTLPVCSDHSCRKCTTRNDCEGIAGGPECAEQTGECVKCTSFSHCPTSTPICRDWECQKCENDTECSARNAGKPICDTNGGECVECVSDDDCKDDSKPVCNSNQCGWCDSDSDCPEQHCVTSGPKAGACVDCISHDDCSGVCTPEGVCSDCATNNDCEMPDPVCMQDKGFCGECWPEDTSYCETIGKPHCLVAPSPIDPNTCVECVDSNNCPPAAPVCDADHECKRCDNNDECPYACDTNTGTCVDCTDSSHCTPGLTCLMPPGTCVDCVVDPTSNLCNLCQIDEDCDDETSGVVCHDGTYCEEGCRGDESGNGCPEGLVCTSDDDIIGECVECRDSDDCVDPFAPACLLPDAVCVGCVVGDDNECMHCEDDTDCEIADGVVCLDGYCIEGCRGDGNGCPPDLVCTSDNAEIGKCVECMDSDDCTSEDAPVCLLPQSICVNCSVGSTDDKCVECSDDDSCDIGTVCFDATYCVVGCRETEGCPGELICTTEDGTIGDCVECRISSDCPPDRPLCESGVCMSCVVDEEGNCLRCELDSDCEDGMVCDATYCREGCRGAEGDCPDGQVCASEDGGIGECVDVEPGVGGTGGANGASGTGGVGGADGIGGAGDTEGVGGWPQAGSGGAGGGSAGSPGLEGSLEGGGCTCSVPAGGAAGVAARIGLLGMLLGVAGLRRRRRAL